MNKSDLAATLAARAGLSQAGARLALDVLFGTGEHAGIVTAALQRGERVQLPGFGTFEVRTRGNRVGRNPRTRERIVIPGGRAPAFRPGEGLRAALRGPVAPAPGPV